MTISVVRLIKRNIKEAQKQQTKTQLIEGAEKAKEVRGPPLIQQQASEGREQDAIQAVDADPDEGGEPTVSKTDDQPSQARVKANTLNQLQLVQAPSRRPQKVTSWPPDEEATRKGKRLLIKCTLDKSYPNFRFVFDYGYLNKREVNNYQIREPTCPGQQSAPTRIPG
ncbi:hypothetical protein DL767_010438 [Monosporascus sp. MG133]|nr:hypothetical protein DL767_010438 [Monosporascus sp. MG133]